MRLHVNDEKSKDIQQVLLNGKLVPTVVEFDTDEGWVISLIPKVSEERMISADDKVLYHEDDYASQVQFEEVKRYGTVEIIWQKT